MAAAGNDKQGFGRGRPPIASRFQKGKSGNPKGRPPKSRDFRKLMEAELDEFVTVTENGKLVRLTKRQLLVKRLVNSAVGGDDKSVQAILKYLGGAAEQDPVVVVDPAEIARFALRHLPATPGPEVAEDREGSDEEPLDGDGSV